MLTSLHRYLNHLDPGIRKGEWTHEEEQVLLTHLNLGNMLRQSYMFVLNVVTNGRWSSVTEFLPGRLRLVQTLIVNRTDNMIKNHWNGLLSKSAKVVQLELQRGIMCCDTNE
jgi:hypothetical protein